MYFINYFQNISLLTVSNLFVVINRYVWKSETCTGETGASYMNPQGSAVQDLRYLKSIEWLSELVLFPLLVRDSRSLMAHSPSVSQTRAKFEKKLLCMRHAVMSWLFMYN